MIYSHRWGAPSIVIVPKDGRRVSTIQQACERCGTSRNPLTGGIVRFRKAEWCREIDDQEPQRDYSKTLARLKQQLDGLEADGYDVDREYGLKRKPSRPELPLAYKD
jgi:hypothetical protein